MVKDFPLIYYNISDIDTCIECAYYVKVALSRYVWLGLKRDLVYVVINSALYTSTCFLSIHGVNLFS